MTRLRTAAAALASALAFAACTAKPTPASDASQPSLTPVLSVKELMQHIVDPQADYAFDAVIVDVGPKGVVETTPTTDEDWTRIERGMWVLAESSNLLKMPRKMAPDGARNTEPGGPELTPAQIEAKVKENPALWSSHADQLQAEALKIVEIVKARDTQKLLDAGSALDRACEACHLDFWYPGDRAAVQKDRESTVYTVPKK
ncbi:MAG TPA: hypothetical protein VFO31_02230 [Vicinamibacterales bacterium]|nr:hypothetical protein [Vicinamibacterales bacterium]